MRGTGRIRGFVSISGRIAADWGRLGPPRNPPGAGGKSARGAENAERARFAPASAGFRCVASRQKKKCQRWGLNPRSFRYWYAQAPEANFRQDPSLETNPLDQ